MKNRFELRWRDEKEEKDEIHIFGLCYFFCPQVNACACVATRRRCANRWGFVARAMGQWIGQRDGQCCRRLIVTANGSVSSPPDNRTDTRVRCAKKERNSCSYKLASTPPSNKIKIREIKKKTQRHFLIFRATRQSLYVTPFTRFKWQVITTTTVSPPLTIYNNTISLSHCLRINVRVYIYMRNILTC